MSDVFISYAREDRATAEAMAQALQAAGLTVWWDRVIPPGRQFDEVIEEALDASRCVVVLWSVASAASKWVKAEAGEALAQDKLVPAMVAPGLRLPLEFRRVQAADLTAWRPGEPSAELDAFCQAVAAQVAAAPMRTVTRTRPRRPPPPPAPPAPPPATPRRWWPWVAGGVITVGVVSAFMETPAPAPEPVPAPSPMPMPQPSPAPAPAPAPSQQAGFDQTLRWRDYVIGYEGRLQWDGRSTVGSLAYRAVDSGTGLTVGQGALTMLLMPSRPNGRLIFHAQIPLPAGDSRTPGAHTHPVNLIFEPAGNGWALTGNCMALDRPDQCWR